LLLDSLLSQRLKGSFCWDQQLFRVDNWNLVCDCGGSPAPELYEIIPEVQDMLDGLAYREEMGQFAEFKAIGEEIWLF